MVVAGFARIQRFALVESPNSGESGYEGEVAAIGRVCALTTRLAAHLLAAGLPSLTGGFDSPERHSKLL